MHLGKLSKGLKAAYRGSNVARRVEHLDGWIDRAAMGEGNGALETVGFQVIEGMDRAVEEGGPTTPWYRPMETRHGTWGSVLLRIPLGRTAFIGASKLAEVLRVFPKGSTDVLRFMDRTANAYVAGGRAGIFTPLYCFLARKPQRAGD